MRDRAIALLYNLCLVGPVRCFYLRARTRRCVVFYLRARSRRCVFFLNVRARAVAFFFNVRARAVVFHMFTVATWQFIEVPVIVAFSRVSLVLASPQKVLFGVKCTLPSRIVKMYSFGGKKKGGLLWIAAPVRSFVYWVLDAVSHQ